MNENTNNPINQYFIPTHTDEDYKCDLLIEVIKDKSVPIKVIRKLRHIVVTKVYLTELVKSSTIVRLIDHSGDSKEGIEEQRYKINHIVLRDGNILNKKQKKEINESLPQLANSPVDNSYEIIELSLEPRWTNIKKSVEKHVSKMYCNKPEIELISVDTTFSDVLYKPYWYVELVNESHTYKYVLDGNFDGNFLENVEQVEHPVLQILEMFGKIMDGLGNKGSSGNGNNTIQDFVNKEIDSVINGDRLDHRLVIPVTWIAVILVIDVLASICLGLIDYFGWLILVNVVAWPIILLLYWKCMRMFTHEDIPTRVKAAQKLFGETWENIDSVMQVNGVTNGGASLLKESQDIAEEDAEETADVPSFPDNDLEDFTSEDQQDENVDNLQKCVVEQKQVESVQNSSIEPEIVHSQVVSKANFVQNTSTTSDTKPKSNKGVIIAIIALLLLGGGIGGWFYYKNVYLPEKRDAEAPRYYTFATSVRMRSTSEFDVEYNKMESLPYGTEVLVYDSMPGEYFYGKVAPRDATGKVIKDKCMEGYVAYPYMLPKSDFFLLNSIFGDDDARQMLDESRYRRALLQYFKKHNYVGDIPADKLEMYGLQHLANAPRWQVFCKNKKATSNNVYRSRKYNKESKYPDVAIILKNLDSGERWMLFYTFDDDETPHLLCEQAAPRYGYMKDGTLKLIGSYYSGYNVDVTYVD